MAEFNVTDDQLSGPWGTPFRIAHKLLECICTALECSVFGLPTRSDKNTCGHGISPDDDTACKVVMPGSELKSLCCGLIAVGVGRMFWHDGKLKEVKSLDDAVSCHGDLQWGLELSVAVLRCAPSLAGKWGGLPNVGVGGLASPAELGDQAALFSSDQMAILMAVECCLGAMDELTVGKSGKEPRFLPAPVEPYVHAANCRGSISGWGRSTPIRVNLNENYLPCATDCIGLVPLVTDGDPESDG